MSDSNKAILQKANTAVSAGNNEEFLAFCADEIVWTTIGSGSLYGKDAVREWMAKEYVTPPQFTVHSLIADGDFVVAVGEIASFSEEGRQIQNAYCDVWRFEAGKMIELNAFVVQTP
jgi:uncharacterized protein